jgi:LCP family protein required for cell wall assembly
MEVPRPVTQIDFPDRITNIMIMGSDRRPGEGHYRTDTMMIVSLDPDRGSATLLSIPRDLYVYIPGWRMDRVNTAEPRGGFKMLSDTILYNLGIHIDHWVRVEFNGLVEAIDLLGGIEVRSTGFLYDECGGRYYTYTEGKVYPMDGFTALCYTRMRKRSSDFDRLRRQQEVIEAMFRKVVSIDGLQQIPELFDLFKETFATDMVLEDILSLTPLAEQLASDPLQVRRFRIDQTLVTNWRVPSSGAQVLLPKREAIEMMLQQAFGDLGSPQ